MSDPNTAHTFGVESETEFRKTKLGQDPPWICFKYKPFASLPRTNACYAKGGWKNTRRGLEV